LSTTESVPPWYGVAYFVVGPAAAFIGAALHSLRPASTAAVRARLRW